MDKITEMKQKRAALIAQARAILDRAEGEKRSLTAEDEAQYNAIMADADKDRKNIEREEALQNEERALRRADSPIAAGREQIGTGAATSNPLASEEYRNAHWRQIRYGQLALRPDEYRTLTVGTGTAGGFLVPEEFERRIIIMLLEENVMRRLSTIITTSADRKIPVVDSHGVAFWTGELGEMTESLEVFGQRLMTAHKLTVMMRISEELLQDTAFDLEAYVAREFARRAGILEEAAYVNGDGLEKPRGVIRDALVGFTAASPTAIAADEIIRTFHSLRPTYRARATWLMNDATALAIRLLRDTTNQYLWQPGMQAGQPDTLLGRPVVVSPHMPTIAATNRSIAFGDFSYYWVADRQGRIFQRLDELFISSGRIGFRAWQRVDGQLVLPEAVRVLVHP